MTLFYDHSRLWLCINTRSHTDITELNLIVRARNTVKSLSAASNFFFWVFPLLLVIYRELIGTKRLRSQLWKLLHPPHPSFSDLPSSFCSLFLFLVWLPLSGGALSKFQSAAPSRRRGPKANVTLPFTLCRAVLARRPSVCVESGRVIELKERPQAHIKEKQSSFFLRKERRSDASRYLHSRPD